MTLHLKEHFLRKSSCNKRILLAKFSVLLLVAFLGVALTACNTVAPSTTSAPTATPSAVEKATAAPTETSTSTPPPSPTPAPTATPTPAALSSTQIFDKLSPAVVFIDTPVGTGSGLLIDDGYILTNAHVVYPLEKVRVVFPDGTEYLDVPVLNWDLLGDLAVLGPIETDVTPAEIVDVQDTIIGAEVFLIGYPGEVDEFPQPTITRGLISRLRRWEPIGITYYQTDATVGGGQSGGILVSELGEVMGISNFSFSDAGFGLVAAARDILPRVESLIAGDNVAGLGNRKLPVDGGQKKYPIVDLEHEWDSQVYIVNEPEDTEIELKVNGRDTDVAFVVLDAIGGVSAYVDDGYSGIETGSFVVKVKAPYFIEVFQKFSSPHSVSVEANRNLIPFVDLDDNRGVAEGTSVNGNLDFPGDIDPFRLVLQEGETVNIVLDSILLDPYLVIARPGYGEEQLVTDDNSGGGMFGASAELTFIAPDSGSYLLIVKDADGYRTGGYSLQIRKPYDGGPTPVAPKPTVTPVYSEFGAVSLYQSQSGLFSIRYPASWTDDPAALAVWQAFCKGATACFAGNSVLIIAEEDMSAFGDVTLDDYVDFYLKIFKQSGAKINIESQEEVTTDQGLTGQVLTLDFNGLAKAKRFMFIHKNKAFNATYLIPNEGGEDLLPFIEYSFKTFKVAEY